MAATALLAGSLAPLNSTMIVVALPQVLADLDAPLAWGSWIVVSYLVAMAAMQPLGGSLGDRYGRRRLVVLGLGGFLLASLAAAVAPTVEAVIAARTAQAVAGAVALPNGSALVRTLVPLEGQGRVLGLIGTGIGAAAAFGPPLGGLITDAFGWRWIFLANVVVIVPALVLALRLPREGAPAAGRRFDLLGGGLLLASLVTLALAATVWRVPEVPAAAPYALAAFGLASGAWFWRHARRADPPVLNLGLLSRRAYLAAGLTVMFSNMTMYTVFLAVPLFVAGVLGWPPGQVGLLLAAMSVPMMLLGPAAGWLADRYGPRLPALGGCAIAALGVALLTAIGGDWSRAHLLLPLVVVGVGMGLSSAPTHTAALQAAGRHEAGQAAGLYSTMRYLGSIVCSAGIAAVLGDGGSVPQFRLLFVLLVGAAVVAAATSSRLPAGLVADRTAAVGRGRA